MSTHLHDDAQVVLNDYLELKVEIDFDWIAY